MQVTAALHEGSRQITHTAYRRLETIQVRRPSLPLGPRAKSDRRCASPELSGAVDAPHGSAPRPGRGWLDLALRLGLAMMLER